MESIKDYTVKYDGKITLSDLLALNEKQMLSFHKYKKEYLKRFNDRFKEYVKALNKETILKENVGK